MTIRALMYGGIQATGMRARTTVLYDGASLEIMGTTLKDGMWVPAGCTISLNPSDALDVALQLIRAAEAHGKHTQKQVDVLVRRLAKTRHNAKVSGAGTASAGLTG